MRECAFCKTNEKYVRYMLSNNDVCICDSCLIQFANELNVYIKKENDDLIDELISK